MTNQELAYEIAKGIIKTGIEGQYNSVSCSTAGDYPSMGASQWEGLGGRGDALLSAIPGAERFVGRTYSDIVDSGELQELKDLLGSEAGIDAQSRILAEDTPVYVDFVQDALSSDKAIIYAGMWCPTGHGCVRNFLLRRKDDLDLNNLEVLMQVFRDGLAGYNPYWIAAEVGEENAEGYTNRANITYDYVASLA